MSGRRMRIPGSRDEKAFIRTAVEDKGLPFLGLCLGHQLLAEALGGAVSAPPNTPEIGVMDVQLTEAGATGVLFDGLPERFETLQWHSAEVKQMPRGRTMPRNLPGLRGAGYEMGHARGLDAVSRRVGERTRWRNWADIPEYATAHSTRRWADGAVARHLMRCLCRGGWTNFNAMAERLYMNWLQLTAQGALRRTGLSGLGGARQRQARRLQMLFHDIRGALRFARTDRIEDLPVLGVVLNDRPGYRGSDAASCVQSSWLRTWAICSMIQISNPFRVEAVSAR